MAEIDPTAPVTSFAVPATPSPLRRLPGRSPSLRGGRFSAQANLWIDGTQLVQENVRAYTQEIQRFALADIQSIQVRRTPRGLVYNVILLALTALPLTGLATTWNDATTSSGERAAFGITAGFFAVFLLINLLRGATCRTTLTTALGTQRLISLSRMGATRRAVAQIAANVAAIQGAFAPDEAARAVDHALAQTRAEAPAALHRS